MNDGGWRASAPAWIAQMGEHGDNGRKFVLDPAVNAWLNNHRIRRALDVGCGEGRVSRLMKSHGIEVTGIDPTEPMIEQARARDPEGDYSIARAEALPFDDGQFDLVLTCLTLIDIPDFRAGIKEMARVLEPGGHLLALNLTGLQSAAMELGWQTDTHGAPHHFGLDRYGTEWSAWVEWAGIRIENWHRPLGAYMQAYLSEGLILKQFQELDPAEGYFDEDDKYARAPWFNLMAWQKPL